jgi:hypothetical protein
VNNSCKKDSGQGGRASIKGRVFALNYNSNSMSYALDSGYVGGQKVYIVYGDGAAVGDNQDTNYDGTFEFPYLRPGKYKVFTFSKNKVNHLDSAVIKTTEITARKQTVELPDLKIKTSKN